MPYNNKQWIENVIYRLLFFLVLFGLMCIPIIFDTFVVEKQQHQYTVCRAGYVFNRDIRGNEVQIFSKIGPITCDEL